MALVRRHAARTRSATLSTPPEAIKATGTTRWRRKAGLARSHWSVASQRAVTSQNGEPTARVSWPDREPCLQIGEPSLGPRPARKNASRSRFAPPSRWARSLVLRTAKAVTDRHEHLDGERLPYFAEIHSNEVAKKSTSSSVVRRAQHVFAEKARNETCRRL